MTKKLINSTSSGTTATQLIQRNPALGAFKVNQLTCGIFAASALLFAVPAWAAPYAVDADKTIMSSSSELTTLNAADGGITINSGTLTLDATTADLSIGTAWQESGGSGKIEGAGNLTITGAETHVVTLGGRSNENNGLTGNTTVTSGTFVTAAENVLSSMSNVTISDGATLDLKNFNQTIKGLSGGTTGTANLSLGTATLTINNTDAFEYKGKITSDATGGLSKSGAGVLTLSGDNTAFTGSTIISAGTLVSSSTNALANSKAVTLSGTGVLNISTQAQSLNNLTATAGTINLGAALTVTYQTPVTDSDTSAATPTIAAVIAGTNNLTKAGTGDLQLTGTNTYTGATKITGGKLIISKADNLGMTSVVEISEGAVLVADTKDADFSLEKSISGGGGLEIKGANVLTISGTAKTYSGSTNVIAGTLKFGVADAIKTSSAVDVAAGAKVNITGYDQEFQLIAGAGTIELAGQNLTLNISTSKDSNFTGSLTNDASVTTNKLIKKGDGVLILSGDNSAFTANTEIHAGKLRLLNTDGKSLSGSQGIVVKTGGELEAADNTTQNIKNLESEAGSNIAISSSKLVVTYDSDKTIAGNITGDTGSLIKEGSGKLTLSGNTAVDSANVFTGSTVINSGTLEIAGNVLASSKSVTVKANGTLNITDTFSLKNLTSTNVVTEATDSVAAVLGTGGIINIASGNLTAEYTASEKAYTIAGNLTGAGNFTKKGADATLILSGDNNAFTGNITADSGILEISANKNLGTGTLTVGTGGDKAANLRINVTSASADETITKAIAGTGGLIIQGSKAHKLILNAANSYTGRTSIAEGTLESANADALSKSSEVSVNGTSTLNITTGAQTLQNLNSEQETTINLDAALTATYKADNTIAGKLAGAATHSFTKEGSNTLTLSGDNSGLLGAVTVANGTLKIIGENSLKGSGLALSAATSGLLIDTGTTAPAIAWSYDKIISGSGTVTKAGAGKVVLSGVNTYSGDTTVSKGELELAALAGNVTIADDATLIMNTTPASMSAAYDKKISGTAGATFIKTGAGELTLSGTDTASAFMGNTIIKEGKVKFDKAAGFVGSQSIQVDGGELEIIGSTDITLNNISSMNTGVININTSAASGASTPIANLTVTYAADMRSDIAGNITGTGGFIKAGAGTLTLSGDNSKYTGAVAITGGLLQITKLKSLNNTVAVSSGSQLAFNTNADNSETGSNWSFEKVISDAGDLRKTGKGDLKLTGANTYTGKTLIEGGTLTVGATDTLAAASAITVSKDSNLVVDSTAADITLANDISGAGGLIVQGANALTLSGTSTYTGATEISAGTLKFGMKDVLKAAVPNISGGGLDLTGFDQQFAGLTGTTGIVNLGSQKLTLNLAKDSSFVFAGNITGSGALDVTGAGTQILNGAGNSVGMTTLSGGTLLIGDKASAATAKFTSTGITLAGGTLAGFGAITGNVIANDGSTLSPGGIGSDVIGMLDITGDITFNAGSTLNYDIAENGSADKINVTGTTTINGGTLRIIPATGIWKAGQSYDVITATTLSKKTDDGFIIDGSQLAFLNAAATYADNKVSLILTPKGAGTETGGPVVEPVRPPVTVELPGVPATFDTSGYTKVTETLKDITVPTIVTENQDYSVALDKKGSEKLIINSNVAVAQGTTVMAGTLQVGDDKNESARLISHVIVKENATLAGHGTVTGNVHVEPGGMLAPGGSIGTLKIGGDFTFDDKANLLYDIAENGTADLISIAGTATINGGSLTILPAAGKWVEGRTYTVLTAKSVVKNKEFTLNADQNNAAFAFLNLDPVQYNATDVKFSLSLKDAYNAALYLRYANNKNQRSVATALGSQQLGKDNLRNATIGAGVSEVAGIYNSLSPEIYATARNSMLQNSHYVRNVVLQSQKQFQAEDNAVWISTWGHGGTLRGDAKYTSISSSNKGWGVAVGSDFPLMPNVYGGLMAGYERSSINNRDGNNAIARTDANHIGAYIRADIHPFKLNSGLIYSYLNQNVDRRINSIAGKKGKLSSKNSGQQMQLFAELNREFHLATSATLTPYFNVAHVWQSMDDVKEGTSDNVGVAAVEVKGGGQGVTFATLGLRGAVTLPTPAPASLYATVGWQHAFGNINNSVSSRFSEGNSMISYGSGLAQNSALISTGVSLQIGNFSNLSFSYQGEFGTGRNDNGGRLQWQTRF